MAQKKTTHLFERSVQSVLTVSTFRVKHNYLNLTVGLNELLKAHLLLQVEAKFFQTTEDAVMIRCLYALVLSTAVCGAAGFISSHDINGA